MRSQSERRKCLKLSNPREIRKALSRIANMVLNHEIDGKTTNSIVYICNAILGTFNRVEDVEGGSNDMKSNRQFTIQQLLRAAEITGDSERREQYLNEADKLIRAELSREALAVAKRVGVFQADNA